MFCDPSKNRLLSFPDVWMFLAPLLGRIVSVLNDIWSAMKDHPTELITEDNIADFESDGVVCLRGVFDAHWLDIIETGMEQNFKNPGRFAHYYARDDAGKTYLNDVASWQRIPEYRRYVFESPAAEIAARLMRSSKVNIFYDSAFYRTAGTSAPTPWHQDVPYWCIRGTQVCSVWSPVDPVPRHSALDFIRGSHKWEEVFYRPSFFSGEGTHTFESDTGERDQSEGGRVGAPEVDTDRGDHDVLAWEMRPGDCLIFSGMVFHGGRGNHSSSSALRALATRWAGDDATYALKPEGADPQLEGHGLTDGDPFGGEMFPVAWPRVA